MQIRKNLLCKEIIKVYRGKNIIKKLTKKYERNRDIDFFIVLTKNSLETSICVLLYLNLLVKQFEINKRKLEKQGRGVLYENEKFIILTDDNRLINNAKLIFPRLTEIVLLNESEMECVIRRYLFMYIDARFIIGCIEINGRDCRSLIGKCKISLNEIVAKSILGIEKKYYDKWKVPQIDLTKIDNQEIIDNIIMFTDKGKKNETETGTSIKK